MAAAERLANVRTLWPLLIVRDAEASARFYRHLLGFAQVAQSQCDGRLFWCRLERGDASIMLQQADDEDGAAAGRGRGVVLYVVVDDVEAIYREFTARGLTLSPPAVAYYGMKQLRIPEPDGYELWFESPVERAF